jgi:glycerol-3-phosphate acyltransferase PlsY
MHWAIAVIIAYLLGSIPFGKIIAKQAARLNITEHGSRNIGATNVAREIGLKWGVLTLLLDTMKGFAPVFLFRHLASGAGLDMWAVGLAALLGHQFSIYMGLKGGKGVATALGVFLAISPLFCLACLVIFVIIVKWSGFVSLGSMLASLSIPVFFLIRDGIHSSFVFSAAIAALICIKHHENIQRLVRGQERKWGRRAFRKDAPEDDPAPQMNSNRG